MPKGKLAILAGALVIASMLLAFTQAGAAPPIREVTAGWELTNAVVVDPGKTMTTPQGVLTQNVTIKADAQATTGQTAVQIGTFQIKLSVFSPAADMPGQQAGMFYVKGDWSITRKVATAAELKARHSPAVVKGFLSAALPFNPATAAGSVAAKVMLPMSLGGGHWMRGQGDFLGNEKFEGVMVINANVFPEAHAVAGGRP